MSDIKISEMIEADEIKDDDYIPIVQDETNKKAKLTNIKRTIVNDGKWKDLTLNANWANVGGVYPFAQYRKINNQVFLRGIIRNDNDTGTLLLGTLPEDVYPTSIQYCVFNNTDQFASGFIEQNGNIYISNYVAGTWLSIATSFFID